MENKENLANRKQFVLQKIRIEMNDVSKDQSKPQKQKNPKPSRRANIGEGKREKGKKDQIKEKKGANEAVESSLMTEETQLCQMRLELGELLTEQANLKSKEKKLRQSIRKLQRNANSSLLLLNHESIEEVLARIFISRSTPDIVIHRRQNIKSALWEMSYQTPEYEESRKRRRVSFAQDRSETEIQCNEPIEIVVDETIEPQLSVEVIDLDQVQGSSILSQLLQEFEKPVEASQPQSFEKYPFEEIEEEVEFLLHHCFHPENESTLHPLKSFEALVQGLTDETILPSHRKQLKDNVLSRLGECKKSIEKSLLQIQQSSQIKGLGTLADCRSSQIEIDLTEDGSEASLCQPLIPPCSDQSIKQRFSLLNGQSGHFNDADDIFLSYSREKGGEKQFVQKVAEDNFVLLEDQALELRHEQLFLTTESFEVSMLKTSDNHKTTFIQQETISNISSSQLASFVQHSESRSAQLISSSPFSQTVGVSVLQPAALVSDISTSLSSQNGFNADNTDWVTITDEQLKVIADQYGLRFENRPKLISLLKQMAIKFQSSANRLPSSCTSTSTSTARKTKATNPLGLQELKEFLESESDLYQQILCFMPIPLDEIYNRIQNKGFYTTKEQLLPLLDSLAIFISTNTASGDVPTRK